MAVFLQVYNNPADVKTARLTIEAAVQFSLAEMPCYVYGVSDDVKYPGPRISLAPVVMATVHRALYRLMAEGALLWTPPPPPPYLPIKPPSLAPPYLPIKPPPYHYRHRRRLPAFAELPVANETEVPRSPAMQLR